MQSEETAGIVISRPIYPAVALILALASTQASGWSFFAGYTGNPADRNGATCAACHTAQGSTLFSGATTMGAGTTSQFTLTRSTGDDSHFNLSADIGSPAPADAATASYAASSSPAYGAGLSPVAPFAASYDFQWTAPPQGAMVTFYACSGFSNGIISSVGCGTHSITVQGPPAAGDDRLAVLADSTDAPLGLLANDTSSDTLTISALSTPDSGGSVTLDGAGPDNRVLYTPLPGFSGTETFMYTLRDSLGGEATATVTVLVGSGFPPARRVVASTGHRTPISFADPAVGSEFGLVAPYTFSRSLKGPWRPGRHEVLWTVTDANGDSLQGTQIVDVLPRISLSVDQSVIEGDPIYFYVHLNGPPPEYPVTYTLTESGSADAGDYFLEFRDGDISAGLSEFLFYRAIADGQDEGDEQVTFTVSDPQNAVLGARASHTVTLSASNTPPRVFLQVEQAAGNLGPLLLPGNGQATISAGVTDNLGQSHGYAWSSATLADNDGDAADNQFGFDPATLTVGSTHLVEVTVTDDGQPARATRSQVLVSILAGVDYDAMNANPDDADDDDGDGTDDAAEGFNDVDLDGIPDHLDSSATPINQLQNQSGDLGRQRFIETEAGLRLRLGVVARRALRYGAAVSAADIAAHGASGGGPVAIDSPPDIFAGPFDFEIAQVPPGAAVNVVLPLDAPLPAGAALLKFVDGEWHEFSVDASNRYASASAEEGACPAPDSSLYIAGLGALHDCILLLLEDGGPNDADGEANGVIADPSAIALEDIDDTGGAGSVEALGNGNAWTPALLLAMCAIGLLAWVRVRAR